MGIRGWELPPKAPLFGRKGCSNPDRNWTESEDTRMLSDRMSRKVSALVKVKGYGEPYSGKSGKYGSEDG